MPILMVLLIKTRFFLSALVEQNSEHTIAKAIVEYAKKQGITTKKIEKFQIIPSIGAIGEYKKDKIFVWDGKLLKRLDLKIPETLKQYINVAYTKVWVGKNSDVLGVILLKDKIKDESKIAIVQFKKDNIKVYMLTGDNKDVAIEVANEIGIDNYFSVLMPTQKVEIIENPKKEGRIVAIVGDGINDAPALLKANVGIAIGAGTDIAAQSADIILTKNSLLDVVYAYKLSKSTYKKMIQNLWWASGYNIVTIPLAAGVLASYGILIEPAIGAMLMSASTVIVAINAQFLKRFKADEDTSS
ncbi:HAD-IC family P-type ATPase [Nitrosophilus labii]|uniref:HAD-IC family P-type ATPase n=1 Tax=Nitrosophilus labii TaxID=2706014 RepID=UPI0018D9552F|nr:HAD-IC family P-type ATPase [Nitrosophilus labii]